jgi:pyrroloquinoline-quinone synthase
VNRGEFREALLQIMERKVHWAWPSFGDGTVPRDKLHLHFEQEYATYVRDFPVLVGWAYVQCPVAEVRRDLAENLYEEETGGKIAGKPHPELFLEYPRGLGMDLARFQHIELGPHARAFRAVIDEHTQRHGWAQAAAVTTIFLEGTDKERGELDPSTPKRPVAALEDHPLVVHYGLPIDALALTKAHRRVEGSHREAAWRCFDHVAPADYAGVIAAMERALAAWLAYRDEVAAAVGLTRA